MIKIFIRYGNSTFDEQFSYKSDEIYDVINVVTGQFNKGKHLDLAIISSESHTLSILFGNGNGIFSSPIKYSLKQNSILASMIVQDLNKDLISNIAMTCFVDEKNHVSIIYRLGERRFLPAKMHSTRYPIQPTDMSIKNINNDGQLDFPVSSRKKDKVIFMSENDSEPLGPLRTFSIGSSSSPSVVAVFHLHNDQKLDIVIVKLGTNDVFILLGDGNFMHGKRYSTGEKTLPNSIVVKDMDNDQRNDIIVTDLKRDHIRIFYNDGNGDFALSQIYSTSYGSEPSFVSVEDLGRDNVMDMVVANPDINRVLILSGAGNRTFSKK